MINPINYSQDRASLLVELRPRLVSAINRCTALFVTISPNPNVKHSHVTTKVVKGRTKRCIIRIPYDKLSQSEQYDYCLQYFREIYLQYFEDQLESYEFVGTWEINKSNNVHLHIVLYQNEFKTVYDLALLRRYVSNRMETLRNMSSIKKPDYMNSICFVNDDFDIRYFDKDHDQKIKYFNNFFSVYHIEDESEIQEVEEKKA